MVTRLSLFASLVVLTVPATAQSPVVARYHEAGKPSVVSRDDLGEELFRRFGRTDQGRAALKFLIDLELTRRAAAAAKVLPNQRDTQAWVAALARRLHSAGMDLASLRAQKGMSVADFDEFASLQLAQERLVRRALELGENDAVTPSMLNLWLEEARRKAKVITDPAKLSPGVVAVIDGHSLTYVELGRVLAGTVDQEVREKYTRQIVLKRQIAARAAANQIMVTAAEMATEVDLRRQQAEANPAYRGVAFEDLLKSQGTSIAELKRSPVLRAQLQERKLLARMLPESAVDERLRTDRAAVLAHHGARRKLHMILVRAPRSDAVRQQAALNRANEVRKRIASGMPFVEAARTFSEDPYTRVSGGDTGWHHRVGSKLPEAVIEAAFTAAEHQLTTPIESDNGYYLVQVAGVEEEPNDATLRFRIRQSHAVKTRAELLSSAEIQFADVGRQL